MESNIWLAFIEACFVILASDDGHVGRTASNIDRPVLGKLGHIFTYRNISVSRLLRRGLPRSVAVPQDDVLRLFQNSVWRCTGQVPEPFVLVVTPDIELALVGDRRRVGEARRYGVRDEFGLHAE